MKKDSVTMATSGSLSTPGTRHLLRMPVLVAALGYMVDMYDLFIFSIVRVPSLTSLGLPPDRIMEQGIMLLNVQMAGMLIGGIVWGIMGDKKGRLSVLFGSILIYSLANIGNGMVTSVGAYAVLRFIAGFGLAGELGAGMTLVSEILPARIRGYGATLVATLGVIGALLAYLVSSIFDWRTAYFIGGGLGLLLMILRVRVFESGIFLQLKQANVRRGDLLMLLSSIPRLAKYINGIVIGMPIWFVVGILITFSPEFGKALGLFHPVDAGKAVMFYFTGQLAGNLVSGFISQRLQSRRKAVLLFILCSASFVLVYLLVPLHTTTAFYTICTCLGFCCGYWTIFIAVAAELFGSNLRATVATTIPNFVRATVIPLSLLFGVTKKFAGTIYGALIVGLIVYVAAVIAILNLEETFKKDMNYNEGE